MDIVFSIHYANNYWIILLPAIMAVADVITGFIQAQVNGTKNSSNNPMSKLCFIGAQK